MILRGHGVLMQRISQGTFMFKRQRHYCLSLHCLMRFRMVKLQRICECWTLLQPLALKLLHWPHGFLLPKA